MLKKNLKKILGKNNILKLKKFYWSITGNYLISKPVLTKDGYIKIHKNFVSKIKKNIFVNKYFGSNEINFVNNLALRTQVTKKNSETNYLHGFVIMKFLMDYLKNNKDNITIFETGTARGFSSIAMSFILKKFKNNYIIHTLDIIPHNKKILWNCISDLESGKITRKNLLSDYSKYLKNINFICGISNEILNKLNIDRINFAFLDGSHDYDDIKLEFDYVNERNSSGDMIILDDYTPGVFDGVVTFTHLIKKQNFYEVNIMNNNKKRGYVVLKKK
jgi:hypothetical protein